MTFSKHVDFSNTRILVIGDLMLDQYWLGDTQRISPEAPVPIVKVHSSENRLGGAANAALNAKSLGSNVALAGIVGQDANGEIIKQLIRQHKIQDLVLASEDARTINKLRLISRNQQMLRADFEETFRPLVVEEAIRHLSPQLSDFSVILLSDYNKGTLSNSQALIQQARQHGAKVIIDPKGNDFSKYKNAYLLTPNLAEFELVMGVSQSEQELKQKALKLIDELQLEALLLTRSEHGMSLFLSNGEDHHLPAIAREVFDVTGAGDTVIATLACALAAELPLAQAMHLANTAASIVVARMGATSVTPLELKVALEQQHQETLGVLSVEQLQDLVQFEQQQGRRIVFTNGCFDILHAGHIKYLNEAAQQGDRLIVAVNSDASVKRLKGDERPINKQHDRMSVLASLKAVDWVVVFDDDTPEALLHLLKPDVLVKGGDYTVDQVVGADIVTAYNGDVKVLSVQEGLSTTKIIESIKQQ